MKNILKSLIILAVAAILFCFTGAAFATGISIDGYLVNFDNSSGYPYVDANNRTMVPLRAAMESAGAVVSWNGATNSAIVEMNGTKVEVPLGEHYILRDGNKVTIDTCAVASGGRTYLPIRAVLESFGAIISWDASRNLVVADTQSANSMIHRLENAPSTPHFWNDYMAGVNAEEAGDFWTAVAQYEKVYSSFVDHDTKEGAARLLGHLGECYARIGKYSAADAAFRREAYFWEQVPGDDAIQAKISAERKSAYMNEEMTLYVKTTDASKSLAKTYGVPFESANGTLLGAYAEGEPASHNVNDIEDKFYVYDFPKLTGKDHGIYLLYYPYGTPLSHYESHLSRAKKEGKIIELALEPYQGLNMVYNDTNYLINLAQDMENYGGKFILRFANEMNDDSNGWHTKNPQEYIDAFRYVSKIFKQHAPSVPIMWSPLWYPPNTIDSYYPGDEYVDYVGISSYKSWLGSVDPMGEAQDRARWSQQLDTFYKTYAPRKPIIIAEGGASYRDPWTGNDVTDFAKYNLKDFYTYLPMRYPNIKIAVIFSSNGEGEPYKYRLSERPDLLDTYKNAIQSNFYLTDLAEGNNLQEYYYPVYHSEIRATKEQLNLYVKDPRDRSVGAVQYVIDDVVVGYATEAPYSAEIDFAPYKGRDIIITANVYDTNGNYMKSKRFAATIK